MPQDRTRASLKLLYNISRELSTSLDLRTVLGRILFLSIDNVGAERGTLIVLDEQQRPQEAAIVYNHELLTYTFQQLQAIVEKGLAGWVLRNQKAALIPDTSKDSRWLHRPDDDVARSGAKSAICIPLIARDHVVGILTIVHPEPGFLTEDHLALLQAIADQAGIFVFNARLYDSLQGATRRYRDLFEDSIDPILITDWSGQIIEANHEAVHFTGYEMQDINRCSIFQLHEARMDLLGPACENLADGSKVTYESNLKLRDGKVISIEVNVSKVDLNDVDSLQWILRDLSARKELDSLREDLTAMIYHDLRSPLSNIISSLDMLGAILPIDGNPSLKSIFNIANRSTERMQRLISSLLDINRLEAGQPITNQKSVDVKNLVDNAVGAVQPLLDGKQQVLEVRLSGPYPPILADEDMARRVLINIIENGIKFTPARGKLYVEVEPGESWVQFCVEDTGPGIPMEAREKIFNKFVRLQTDKSTKGLGLGLAFCRLAVEAHGGRIWVEGLSGRGSRFCFTLPTVKDRD
ncbi:MAG TPA: ATP-binding protein [Anaerolineaceae bacterium]|nr:ATP-binding protein [Anaerolineaceae bacterium]